LPPERATVDLRPPAESIRSHRRVPATFAVAVDACLEPNPAERQTVKDLAQALNELISPVVLRSDLYGLTLRDPAGEGEGGLPQGGLGVSIVSRERPTPVLRRQPSL
jgi:hypothetical protein